MIIAYLQKIGLLPRVIQRDIDEAQSEDVLRTSIENSRATASAANSADRFHDANGRLRETIRRVRSRLP